MTITETEFRFRLMDRLKFESGRFNSVTGPGRSGAIASVYASHFLRIPFIPFGQSIPKNLLPVLVVDTAMKTGKTIRKASRLYGVSFSMAIFHEPPRVKFWYEEMK